MAFVNYFNKIYVIFMCWLLLLLEGYLALFQGFRKGLWRRWVGKAMLKRVVGVENIRGEYNILERKKLAG